MVRADLDAVLQMMLQLNAAGTRSDPRYQLAEDALPSLRAHALERWFGIFHPFPVGFVADAGERLVGVVQGAVQPAHPVLEQPPTARIGSLWVDPEWRRQRLATRLVQTYVQSARDAGFPWVEVGTLARDERAVAFWRSAGFGDWRITLLHH